MEANKAFEEITKTEQESAAVEIAPGISVEEMKAMFFDEQALREPGYKLYQLNSGGHRYYYRFNGDGEVEFYPSVTTLLKQTMPTNPFLIKWMVENGAEGATEKRDMAAAYGTFMHAQFERLIIARSYDFTKVPEYLYEFMKQNNLPDKFYFENSVKIKKDVLAFAQFVKDYNVRPLAIEISLVCPDGNFAGCIDMPCIMQDPKSKQDFMAIVDFKSGRKGFYEEHELQLGLYRIMWNYNYPDLHIERIFNFAPKDWRKKPTYTLKEQTGSENLAKIPYLLELAKIEDSKCENTLTIVDGVLDMDNIDTESCITNLSLAELVKSKK